MTETLTTDPKVCLSRSIEGHKHYLIEDISKSFDIIETCVFISDNNYSKVCLQFPDHLLCYSAAIYKEIRSIVNADLYILGDTSYASCCVDEVAASHVNADAVIHYGHSCFSNAVLPTFMVLPKKDLDLELVTQALNKANFSDDNLCLFYDCSYHTLKHQLSQIWFLHHPKSYIAVIKFKEKTELLGRVIKNAQNEDLPLATLKDFSCIYIGTRGQTFLNLTISIPAKSWHVLDPSNGTVELADETAWFKRRRFLIEKCKDAMVIGLLVCKLNGTQTHEIIARMKQVCRASGKKCYIVSVGKPNVAKLANFPEIDVYVLIACPENDLYNTRDMYKPIVYPYELEVALNASREKLSETHITNFEELLPGHKHYCAIKESIECTDVSLITGQVRNMSTGNYGVGGSELVEKENWALENIGNNLGQRSWTGLEQKLGQTEVRKVEQGRTGIALHYQSEPESKQ